MNNENGIYRIGRTHPRRDALSKVTGSERYAGDYFGEDMLFAGVKRAGVPHARITSIHTGRALALDGVVAVLTHRDIRGSNRQGVIRKDQPVLVEDKVRHCGDAVALIIARDREILDRAGELIALDLEPLPAVFDPVGALGQGAPLIHEDMPHGNLLLSGTIERGDVRSAFQECAAVVEARFQLPHQEHAYLETETGWAVVDQEGTLHVTASTQSPFRDRMEVAEALGLAPEKIHITAPYCGGAFGGKDGITVQSLLGLAAFHSGGRPVKMCWDREESISAGVKRHPAELHYRLGSDQEGTFRALEASIWYDTGPYDHLGGAVMTLGLEHAGGPYRIPNALIRAYAVYTNNPIGGAFRGFGVPQVNAAMEQAVDMLAEKLCISPISIRRRNGVTQGDTTPAGVTLTTSTGLLESLDSLQAHPFWRERKRWKDSGGMFKKRGVGIACVMHGMGYGPVVPDTGNARIQLTTEGRFRIYSGVVDMGQGNASTYLQIAGEILSQDDNRMELVLPDTLRSLPSGSSSASRTTYTFGNALMKAARLLKRRLIERASDLFMAGNAGETVLLPGRVKHLPSGREVSLESFAQMLNKAERTATGRFRAPVSRQVLAGGDAALRLHGLPHVVFSYGAHFTMVEVDEITGAVEVKAYLAMTEAGSVLNPQIYEQQVHGAIAQGLGYALMEDFRVEDGAVMTSDFSTYILPTSLDVPDMHSVPVELREESGPFGMKGVGEVVMDGPLPAVANAVADACGIRPSRFPITPERVLTELTTMEERPFEN